MSLPQSFPLEESPPSLQKVLSHVYLLKWFVISIISYHPLLGQDNVEFTGLSRNSIFSGSGQDFTSVITYTGSNGSNTFDINVKATYEDNYTDLTTSESNLSGSPYVNSIWPAAKGIFFSDVEQNDDVVLTFEFTRTAGTDPLYLLVHSGESMDKETAVITTTGVDFILDQYGDMDTPPVVSGQNGTFQDVNDASGQGYWSASTAISGSTNSLTITYTYTFYDAGFPHSEGNGMVAFQSNYTTAAGAHGSLPVDLLNFSILTQKDKTVKIKWETLTETNNSHFDVERSLDAKVWKSIQQIEGAGNSIEAIKYEVIDREPTLGTSYYRLKQTDFNGATSHFSVTDFYLKPDWNTPLQIYPNPTSEFLTVEGHPDEVKSIALYDIEGKNQGSKVKLHERGNFYSTWDLSQLQKGVYLLKTPNHTFKVRKE